MAQSCTVSRRLFIAGGLVVAGGAGALLLGEKGGPPPHASYRHQPGPPASEGPSPQVLATLTAYLGAFFGREFSSQDTRELSDRLTFAATRDSGWGEEYAAAADLLNDGATARGSVRYVDADRAVQMAIIEELRASPSGLLGSLRLAASDAARARERMRVSTSRHLVRLYRHSGVPWRQRGFSTWPGAPDRITAYDRLKDT